MVRFGVHHNRRYGARPGGYRAAHRPKGEPMRTVLMIAMICYRAMAMDCGWGIMPKRDVPLPGRRR